MYKKWITISISIALAFAALGLTWIVGLAKTTTPENKETARSITLVFGKPANLSLGRMGIFMPKSGYSGELEVSRMRPFRGDDMPRPSDLRFQSALLTWSVEKSGERNDAFVHGLTYVYFDLTKHLHKLWKSGDLAIYHWNATNHAWEKLPTHSIPMSATSNGRIATLATGFGTYALGEPIQ